MANTQAAINWFEQRQGRVTYSMGARLGPNSYDCSSAVYFALIAGSFLPAGSMGNTDTLFGALESLGWTKTTTPKRGDIFITGARGFSGGAAGHTGMFVDGSSVIHCNYGANGISTNGYASVVASAGNPPATIYSNPNASPGQPVLNTPQEKRAWSLAKVLNQKGYNLTAIASILGNAEIEVGPSLNPDTEQIGGPAYGIVQWDGSAFPLVGSPTRNGREYVQRLMRQANLTGDYRAIEPQANLIDWCMFNGQWIGVVEPRSVEGFKNVSDVSQGTSAFLKNFERAGVEKEQDRIAAAQRWLAFLNNLPADFENLEQFEVMTNVGHLDFLGISNGQVTARGWHFSSDKATQYISFINAETDEELGRIAADNIARPDVKEVYPNVIGVENSGFEVSMVIPNETAVYVKGIRTNGTQSDELIFDKIIIFEQAFDAEVDTFAESNEKFFFEIYRGNKLVKRGKELLNTLHWANELMYVPTLELELPIEYTEWINGREEMKVFINNKVFHGIVTGFKLNKVTEFLIVSLTHVISEWEYRQVSTNLAAKNRTVNDIYSTLDFRYPGWNVEYMQDSATRVIDYVYSRQDKLEGLTKTCNLTDDLFWRVGFNFGRKLEIGTFGDKKNLIISKKESGRLNRKIISEPTIVRDFENVVNMATVYGEKSDSGMSSMSLRDVYNEKGSFIEGFPVVILKNGINNERGYDYIEFTKLAPNNDLEYSVIDEESIALESGKAIETAYAFNDLAPFNIDGETITDEDRAKAARTAYEAAVKRLKFARRKFSIELDVEQLPENVNVGDRVRFIYDNNLFKLHDCSNYMKKILAEDDWFYLSRIEYNFDQVGGEYNSITLQKYIVVERDVD